MKSQIFVFAVLSLQVAACTTTHQDAAEKEVKAQVETNKAYDRADEKAMKAQNEAEEKSLKAEAEAGAKTDEAYAKAEKKDLKAHREVEEAQRKEFVDTMSKRLEARHDVIKDLKEAAAKRPEAKPRLAALTASEKAAAVQLKTLKKTDWQNWKNSRIGVERAFAQLDQDYNAAIESLR